MKKLITALCVVTLISTAVLPALAEQNSGMQNQPPQMSQSNTMPQNQNGMMPQNGAMGQNQNGMMAQPGGQGGFRQTPPEQPDGDTSADASGIQALPSQSADGTMTPPEKPDGDTSTDALTPPEKPDGDTSASGIQALPGQSGSQPGGMTDPLMQLVAEGKLSETTYTAIMNYLNTNSQTQPASGIQALPGQSASGTQSQPAAGIQALPEQPASGTLTPPEKPDDDTSADTMTPPEKPDGMGAQLQPGMTLTQTELDAMLNDGVITQDEYNIILETLAQPTENTDNASTGTTETGVTV